MLKKLTDIVDSDNSLIQYAIDHSYRTDNGCWIYNGQVDEWGRPWIFVADDEMARLDVVFWEWRHGVQVPVGYDIYSICGNRGCLNPVCLEMWEFEGEETP